MAAQPLPIGESVRNAYARLGELLGQLPRAAAGPYVLSLLLSLPAALFPPGPSSELAFALLSLLPYTLFAVAWHRLVILGPAIAPPRLVPAWRSRHWRFLGYSLLLVGLAAPGALAAVLLAGLLMPAQGVASLLLVVLSVGLAYLFARLSLVLPATALDEPYRLRHAWEHSRGQGLRLLAILLLALLPLMFVTLLVGSLLGGLVAPAEAGSPSAAQFILFQLVAAVIGYTATAISLTVISQAFRSLAGWYPGDQHRGPPARA